MTECSLNGSMEWGFGALPGAGNLHFGVRLLSVGCVALDRNQSYLKFVRINTKTSSQ